MQTLLTVSKPYQIFRWVFVGIVIFFQIRYFISNDFIFEFSLLNNHYSFFSAKIINQLLLLFAIFTTLASLYTKYEKYFLIASLLLTSLFYIANSYLYLISNRHLIFLQVSMIFLLFVKNINDLDDVIDFLFFVTLGSHFISGYVKIVSQDSSWLDGEALKIVLTSHVASMNYYKPFLNLIPEAGFKLMTYSVLAFELSSILFLFLKKYRNIWLYSAFLFHIPVLFLLTIKEISLSLLIYLSCIIVLQKARSNYFSSRA